MEYLPPSYALQAKTPNLSPVSTVPLLIFHFEAARVLRKPWRCLNDNSLDFCWYNWNHQPVFVGKICCKITFLIKMSLCFWWEPFKSTVVGPETASHPANSCGTLWFTCPCCQKFLYYVGMLFTTIPLFPSGTCYQQAANLRQPIASFPKIIQQSNFGRHCSNMVSIPRPNNKCFLGIVMALDLPPSSGKNLSSRGGGEKINLPTTVTVDGPWCFCWSVVKTLRVSRFWKIWTRENHLQRILGSERMG